MRRPTSRGLCFVVLMVALVALMNWTMERPLASSASTSARTNTAFLQATPARQETSASVASITPVEESGTIDMAASGIRPLPNRPDPGKVPGGISPLGAAVGRGRALIAVAPDVVNQSTTSALVTLVTGFTPGETVNYSLNGGAATPFAADAAGKLRINVTTGVGFGYISILAMGLTSGNAAGGIVQVDSTGPYLVGVAAGPHAINHGGVISVYGRGYPASSSVNIYRNGVLLGTSTANAGGRVIVDVTTGVVADTSAVYSVDNGTAGSMSGQSVEERTDAGTGEQNPARAFVDRAVINSGAATPVTLVGEGFQAAETVNLTGSAAAVLVADANGAVSTVVTSGTGAAVYNYVLTGATSTRVARASVLAHANVTNIRGIIVAPSRVSSGSIVTARVDRLPALTMGTFFLNGVSQGTTTTDADGSASMPIVAPATNFVQEVGFIATTGEGQATVLLTYGPTAAPATISGRITTPDGSPLAGVSLRLSGARSARVITNANGEYRFESVDSDNFYTVTPTLVNYHFAPESQSFQLAANNVEAVFTGTRDAVVSGNAIDTEDYFVRQHYLDFLGREPDESGFNFWSDQIRSCGTDGGCRERRTINVSAAYFLSIEFQQTGGLVDGLYRASYGRSPRYAEFMPDTAVVARDVVVGSAGWAQLLEANKQAFVNAWVDRADFRAAYDGLGNDAYVNSVISRASCFNGDGNALVNGLGDGSLTRAAVLRQVAENEGFVRAKHNEMFVMMEYFGYLRRDPDAAGYNFWLNKLNQFGGNFEQAAMVKAFIVSGEYRQRFVN